MSLYVCSLIAGAEQEIPAGSTYRLLRFPYGSAESWDGHGMHQALQPDGTTVTEWEDDDRAGLIRPAVSGWGRLSAMIHWADGAYTEVRSQFARDPLGTPDTTATEDHPKTAGGQYRVKGWPLFVDPGTPLGVRVRHNSSSPQAVFFAELKLEIETCLAAPGGQ